MSIVTSNMGLRSWPDATDKFSFADLAANFKKIDRHTHETGKGTQLGTTAFANLAATGPKFGSDLRAAQFATGALTSSKFTSDPLTVPRRITLWCSTLNQAALTAPQTIVATSGITMQIMPIAGAMWVYNAADYAIAGRTPQLTFKGGYSTNNVAGGTASIAFGLFPITGLAGTLGSGPTITSVGAAVQTFTVPASVAANQTVAFAMQTAAAPTDGDDFVFGMSVSAGTLVSGCVIAFNWTMGIRWV